MDSHRVLATLSTTVIMYGIDVGFRCRKKMKQGNKLYNCSSNKILKKSWGRFQVCGYHRKCNTILDLRPVKRELQRLSLLGSFSSSHLSTTKTIKPFYAALLVSPATTACRKIFSAVWRLNTEMGDKCKLWTSPRQKLQMRMFKWNAKRCKDMCTVSENVWVKISSANSFWRMRAKTIHMQPVIFSSPSQTMRGTPLRYFVVCTF